MNGWLRFTSLVAASGAGAAALTTFTVLAYRSIKRRAWTWASYFALRVLLISLFLALYLNGLLTPDGEAIPFSPWIASAFLLYGVPLFIALSAIGWIALSRENSDEIDHLIKQQVRRQIENR